LRAIIVAVACLRLAADLPVRPVAFLPGLAIRVMRCVADFAAAAVIGFLAFRRDFDDLPRALLRRLAMPMPLCPVPMRIAPQSWVKWLIFRKRGASGRGSERALTKKSGQRPPF
jgi:hypothetical protein